MSLSQPLRIWSALPIPGFLVNVANLVDEMNPAAEAFLNTGKKACSGKRIDGCLAVDMDLNAALERARIGQSVLFQHDVSLTHAPIRASARPVWCDIQIAPLGDGAGTMLLLLHPRHIKGRLGRALKAGSAAKTAIGLADMLAHEIKNPLAGISGAAQLLAMSLGRQDREMTDLILQETRRIVDLLKQVEQFGDLRRPDLRPVNIHDLLERARKSAMLGVAAKMRFCDQYDPSLPQTLADGGQLMQVFTNLFANAAEAAGQNGGVITIRSYFEPGLRLRLERPEQPWEQAVPLQVEISDDGPGIAAEILHHVFDPFITTRENGTGLGLALVSKIIAEHNGTIIVTSRPGLTSFRISLPIVAPEKGPV